MIIKVNGKPLEEIAEHGVDLKIDLIDLYHLVHTPINLNLAMRGHEFFSGDVNLLNFGHHLYGFVKPHIITAFDYLL